MEDRKKDISVKELFYYPCIDHKAQLALIQINILGLTGKNTNYRIYP